MVGIVIVTHGTMAEGIMDAAGMIVGNLEGVRAVQLKEMDAVEDLMDRISAAVDEVDTGDGALVFVDLFGASPFNASARLLGAEKERNVEVITGVSLPMVLEVAIQRSSEDLESLVEIAEDAGTSGVKVLSRVLS
jgi:PTS system mannose-specific IIA component